MTQPDPTEPATPHQDRLREAAPTVPDAPSVGPVPGMAPPPPPPAPAGTLPPSPAPAAPYPAYPAPPHPAYPTYPGQAGGYPQVKSHLVHAIVVTLMFFMPFGVVGLVYASKVSTLLAVGDVRGAQAASASAWKWCKLGYWFGGVAYVLYFIAMTGAVLMSLNRV